MAAKQMHLRVATPSGTVVDAPIASLRAEDDSGFFGIRPRHETMFTSLAVGIVSYRTLAGEERFVAVRRGVLWTDGRDVTIVTRDAVESPDIADLEERVLAQFLKRDEEDRQGGTALTKMQIAALRQLLQYEDVGRRARP